MHLIHRGIVKKQYKENLLKSFNQSFKKGYGTTPVFIREGGSIPVVAILAEILDIPTALMGIGLPDSNTHAPNEKLDLANFKHGTISIAHFFDEFSTSIPN